jgi:hypothetical protein
MHAAWQEPPQSLNDAANGSKHRPGQMRKHMKANGETDLLGWHPRNV